MPVSKLSFYIE